MRLTDVIIIAALAESIWETLKLIFQSDEIEWDRVGAIVISIFIAMGTGVDIFELLNIPFKLPFIGSVLTGLMISRGANFIHDLFRALNLNNEIKTAEYNSLRKKIK